MTWSSNYEFVSSTLHLYGIPGRHSGKKKKKKIGGGGGKGKGVQSKENQLIHVRHFY